MLQSSLVIGRYIVSAGNRRKKSDSGFGAFHVDNGLVERCPKFAVKITKIVREKSITVVKLQAGEDEIIKKRFQKCKLIFRQFKNTSIAVNTI